MRFLVLHGPNLNLLGERPGDAPDQSLKALNVLLRGKVRALGGTVRILQTNHEGALLDALHRHRGWMDAVVINPGALAHSSYALRDAIAAVGKPTYEVHLGDPRKRDAFRRTFVLGDVCAGRVLGLGYGSYLQALEALARSR